MLRLASSSPTYASKVETMVKMSLETLCLPITENGILLKLELRTKAIRWIKEVSIVTDVLYFETIAFSWVHIVLNMLQSKYFHLKYLFPKIPFLLFATCVQIAALSTVGNYARDSAVEIFNRFLAISYYENHVLIEDTTFVSFAAAASLILASKLHEGKTILTMSHFPHFKTDELIAFESMMLTKIEYKITALSTPSGFIHHLLELWPDRNQVACLQEKAELFLSEFYEGMRNISRGRLTTSHNRPFRSFVHRARVHNVCPLHISNRCIAFIFLCSSHELHTMVVVHSRCVLPKTDPAARGQQIRRGTRHWLVPDALSAAAFCQIPFVSAHSSCSRSREDYRLSHFCCCLLRWDLGSTNVHLPWRIHLVQLSSIFIENLSTASSGRKLYNAII